MKDFEELYSLYSKGLYKYLLYICRDRQLAEELLQETYYQAMKSILSFKGGSKVSTWLYQIGRNVCLKHLAKARKVSFISVDEIGDMPCSKTTEEVVQDSEEGIAIINSINKLKPQYREIVCLRLFDELSFREIGGAFNQSEGWARTNFYRAKLQLKDLLSRNNEEVL